MSGTVGTSREASGRTAAAPGRAGLVVRVRRVLGAPVVAVRVWIEGGARAEAIPGQALVTGRLLPEGSGRRDWRAIAEQAEARGMAIESFGTFESHGVAMDALAGDWQRAVDWAAELAVEPSFPEDRAGWIRRQTAAELDSLGDQPEVRTAWAFLDQLYAPHPRGRPIQGTLDSLATLTAADCATFHHRALGGRVLVSIAGLIDEDEVEQRTRELLVSLVPTGQEPPPPAPVAGGERRRELALPPGAGADQAHLYAGHLTVPRDHPDHEALELAGVILGAGAGLTGRIPERIREREGLAYSARAETVAGAGLDPGRLVVYVGTSPATVEQALDGVTDELARLIEDGISERELAGARAYLSGREPFRRETARQWAELLLEAEHYGLPLDRPGWREERLAALDRASVEAAVRRHLRPDALRVTVGRPR